MTYNILIGQRLYSSWSLRGWLPFAVHDIPVTVHDTLIYSETFSTDVANFGGSGTVPAVRTPHGGVLSDSLAICWGLADAFPERGLLPNDPADRAKAQSLIAEMHTGFTALRGACPMNLATGWAGFKPNAAVQADLARIDEIWSAALDASDGPFLFGTYGIVDAFFAPVAIRIAGYALPASDTAMAYVHAQLSLAAIQEWRTKGLARDTELSQYEMPLERCPFPMP
ncbi:MAG: glutathione S-transferase [Paracoccaceae bacterium]|jgi:glutathione S-transferase